MINISLDRGRMLIANAELVVRGKAWALVYADGDATGNATLMLRVSRIGVGMAQVNRLVCRVQRETGLTLRAWAYDSSGDKVVLGTVGNLPGKVSRYGFEDVLRTALEYPVTVSGVLVLRPGSDVQHNGMVTPG